MRCGGFLRLAALQLNSQFHPRLLHTSSQQRRMALRLSWGRPAKRSVPQDPVRLNVIRGRVALHEAIVRKE